MNMYTTWPRGSAVPAFERHPLLHDLLELVLHIVSSASAS
jgi:hypothetical protein